jgi:hypothetical protein
LPLRAKVIAPRTTAAKQAVHTLSQSIERGRLRYVLAAVLTAGNIMNAGTAKGQADGFKASDAPALGRGPAAACRAPARTYSLPPHAVAAAPLASVAVCSVRSGRNGLLAVPACNTSGLRCAAAQVTRACLCFAGRDPHEACDR